MKILELKGGGGSAIKKLLEQKGLHLS